MFEHAQEDDPFEELYHNKIKLVASNEYGQKENTLISIEYELQRLIQIQKQKDAPVAKKKIKRRMMRKTFEQEDGKTET